MQADTVVERPTRKSAFCKSNNVVTFGYAAPNSRGYDFIGMKKLITTLAIVLCCALGGVALAGDPHTSGTKGQPSQNPLVSCEVSTMHPGNAASARGSAFNDSGVAGTHYANPDSKGGISSGNTHVVSQYDVACFQQTIREMQQTARTTERATKMSIGHGHSH